MKWINEQTPFPAVDKASPEGIVALSETMNPEMLLRAYHQGIFPWYNEGEPVIWWSPNPRMVLFPEELKVSKSMRKVLQNNTFQFTQNQCFEQVITACKNIHRPQQEGTWISAEIVKHYTQLHKMGYAHSVEVWQDHELVGGLYGVAIGKLFCGESMFARVSNASKAGFIWWVQQNKYELIDCQVYTDHLASLGAREIPRDRFIDYVQNQS